MGVFSFPRNLGVGGRGQALCLRMLSEEVCPTLSLRPASAPPCPACPEAGQGHPEPVTGQLLLGTDKRNPVFAVYEDDSGQRLLVYYGFEIIEIVNHNPEDPAYKLLLGRLYNAGVKLKALCESFAVDAKTVRRWGAALLQGDPVELIRVLAGRGAGRKRTVAVEKFARLRWPELVAERSYGAVGRLREEIQGVFGVTISRSGLQSLVRELKTGSPPADAPSESSAAEACPPGPNRPESEGPIPSAEGMVAPPGPEIEKGELAVRCEAEGATNHVPKAPPDKALDDQPALPPPGHTAHCSPFFPKDPSPANYWCDHAGVLIFALALAAVAKVSTTGQAILAQWMAALWLGAHNIEQTKFLNWEDLELILGGVVRFPTPQREQLKGLAADPQVLDELWRFNQRNLGSDVGTDFYFDPQKVMGQTTLTRFRNSSTDVRVDRFEYVQRAWAQNPKLRQIVVQATNDKGRTIQVAILTDDLERPAAQIIKLMFQRWVQENDFKYLDQHFGINQITSYRSIEYEQLKGQVEDRQVKSVARKALDLSHQKANEQLKRNLLAEEQALQAHQHRARKRTQLEESLTQEGSVDRPQRQALSRQVAALKRADQRYQDARVPRRALIDQGHQQIQAIQTQIEATQAKESRLESMIQAQMVRMEPHSKRLLDLLRITARNLFYQALQPFKKEYDNFRDDHDHFRNLTQSPGVLEVSAEQIVIHLLPRTHSGGQLRKAVDQTLAKLNAQALEHPGLPGRKLKFRLGQRSEMELKMNVEA